MFSVSVISPTDDVEDLLVERLHHLLRLDWANPPYPAGGEILLDALCHGGQRGLEEPRLELQSRRPRALMRRTQKPFSAL